MKPALPTTTELATLAAHLWSSIRANEDGTEGRINEIAVETALELWFCADEELDNAEAELGHLDETPPPMEETRDYIPESEESST